ncbi:MAG: nuclear transport factor 2 family protein [Thermoplasmata archaeon]
MEWTPKDLIERLIAALNRGGSEESMELFTTDPVVQAGPWFTETLRGRPAIRSFLNNYLYSLPGMHFELKEVYQAREEAVATVHVYATMSQVNPDPVHIPFWQGGHKLAFKGAFRFAFSRDGHIRELQIFGDESNVEWLPRTMERKTDGSSMTSAGT